MRLTVEHTIRFQYAIPRRRLVQSLHLQPVDTDGQKILNWKITAAGASFGAEFTDGAGDKITTLSIAGPVEELSVRVEGEVETSATDGWLKGQPELISPIAYLRETPLTLPSQRMVEMAALCQENDIAVDDLPGVITAEFTLDDAAPAGSILDLFKTGVGSSRDIAHAICALARACGHPARIVKGYVAGREGTQCWAEIYHADKAWRGYDPVTNSVISEAYIRVGSGLDALGASPIREAAALEAADVEISLRVAEAAQ